MLRLGTQLAARALPAIAAAAVELLADWLLVCAADTVASWRDVSDVVARLEQELLARRAPAVAPGPDTSPSPMPTRPDCGGCADPDGCARHGCFWTEGRADAA